MNPSLRLTRELIDQIVFGMENQDRDYVLDTDEAVVIPAEQVPEDAPDDRYVDLPEWRSVDGYNLMEQFVATLHNPIFRERLRSILASGRGVFRQFKDTVRERHEIERLWFNFKERRMREIVSEWFNDEREREGLERLEAMLTETETDQLIETDFVFREAAPADYDVIERFDRDAFEEVYPETDEQTIAVYYDHHRSAAPGISDDACTVLVTETQGGEFAGFLWAYTRRSGHAAVAFVRQLYITPSYRGFGLARELFHHYCTRAHRERINEIQLTLHGSALDLESNFMNYGLVRHRSVLRLDVEGWHRASLG